MRSIVSGSTSVGLVTTASGYPAVNVKDFGAIGDGNSHPLSSVYATLAAAQAFFPAADDLTLEIDYCGIQKAIDFQANSSFGRAILIPAGHYQINQPIYLDPPGSLRSQAIAAWNAGTTYAANDKVKYNGAFWNSNAGGNQNHVPSMSSTFWTWTVGTSPTQFGWGATLIGEQGRPDDSAGSQLILSYKSGPGVLVGPLNGILVRYIQVRGPTINNRNDIGYNGGQDPRGVGFAVCAMSAGSSRTCFEDCSVHEMYTGWITGFTGGALGDSNTWVRCLAVYTYFGAQIIQTQCYINAFYDCNFHSVIGVSSLDPFTVVGGNWSCTNETTKTNAYTMSGMSAMSTDGNGDISFTATITNPDANLQTSAIGDGRAGIYNAFIINTAHFGPVPLIMTALSGSNVGTFQILTMWRYWTRVNVASTDIEAELQAVTTLFACETCTVWSGPAKCYGAFVENPQAPTCILKAGGWQNWDSILSGLTIQYDMTFSAGSPLTSPSQENLIRYYVANMFPTFWATTSGFVLDNILFPYGGGPFFSSERINIDLNVPNQNPTRVTIRDCHRFRANLRSAWTANPFLGVQQAGLFIRDIAGAIGWGEYDYDPGALSDTGNLSGQLIMEDGKQRQPTIGVRPAHYTVPMLPGGSIAQLKTTPTFNATGVNIPMLWGGMLYKIDEELISFSSIPHMLRSNHQCYTYGRDIVNPNVGWTVSWSMKGAQTCVFVDQNTMGLMRVGLVIGLSINAVTEWFMVVAIIPSNLQLIVVNTGYINDSIAGNHGTKTTVYTGSTISQQPVALELMTGVAHPTFVNSAYTLVMGEEVLVDTSGGAVTVTLPPPPIAGLPSSLGPIQGAKVVIRDAKGTFNTNNCTVARNGSNINSAAANATLSTNGQTVTYVYIDTTIGWKSY